MLCYRCGSHVPDGSEACGACGQKFSSGNLRQATGTFSRRKIAGASVDGAPFKTGDLLENRYLIKDVIGAGPLGYVFKAQDKEIEVEVALKAISPKLLQSHDERKTFAREVRLARKLSHNNIVRVYEDGEAQDRPFYTMQYLDGLTLRRIIDLRREKNQFFAIDEIEPIFGQIAAGLDNAHKLGPHSNLKPENVIVLPDLLKLTDFGLGMAVPRQPFAAAQRARGGHRYLAPEYVAGHEVDGRADVYSLGVMLGEMAAGVFPEDGSVPGLRAKNPELSPEVEALYGRAVNENPMSRFATAGEFFAALAEISAKLGKPRPEAGKLPARPERSAAAVVRRPAPPPPPVNPPKQPPPRRAPPPPPVAEEHEPAFARPPSAQGAPTSTEITPVVAPRSERPRRDAKPRPKKKSGTGRLLGLALVGIVAGGGGGYALLTYLNHTAVAEGSGPSTNPIAVQADAGALPVPDKQPTEIAVVIPDAGQQAAQPQPGEDKGQDDARRRAEELKKAEEARKLAEAKAEEDRKRKEALDKAFTGGSDKGKVEHTSHKPTCPPAMRLVPSGSFKMGAAPDDPMMGFDEKPLARVELDAYCIDYFEYPNRRGATPTTNVSFQAAENACKARGKRLCTEEEWERACKGSANLRFPYSNNFDAEACNTEDANGEDRPINSSGTFSRCRSGYGIADMSGNVAEWTSSKYNADLDDRTLKGGASDRPDYATRCAARKNGPPGTRNDRIGFRCCADPK